MGKLQTMICRLCLQKCVDFNAVEDYVKDVLEVLLLKINLAFSEEPVMCTKCAAMLMRSFDFKATCFYAHDFIVPFLDEEKISKLDLKKVYTGNHNNIHIPDDHSVCGFCMGLAKKCKAYYLDNEEGDFMLQKMVKKYLPELDFSTIEEPVICAYCYESLNAYFHFVTSCLIVEEKIMDYRKLTGTDFIEIADVLQLASRNVSNVEDGNTIDIIKEGKFCVESGNADGQVGHENASFVHMEDQKFLMNKEVEIKTDQSDFDRFQEPFNENKTPNDSLLMSVVTSETRKRRSGSYETNHKLNLGQYKSPSEIKMFECAECSYKTIHKSHLKLHLLIHKSPSEIKMFKCELCSFETKYKHCLKRHLLTHKSPSKIEIFKCAECPYKTKHKGYHKLHLLAHKNHSEIKMFNCELCSFETKYKHCLEQHLLTHKSPSEIKMFKCELCSFETKYKRSLEQHLLIHKNPCEIDMFKCELCSYVTKHKNCLKAHLLTHRSPSEMFKCELCSFVTKYKQSHEQHLLTHKSRSEIKMFNCELCSFGTKYKHSLEQHLFTHKSPSEIKMFKCELCPYEAKHKYQLNKHLLDHKGPSEIKRFKCGMCPYETKLKANLKRHLLTHKTFLR